MISNQSFRIFPREVDSTPVPNIETIPLTYQQISSIEKSCYSNARQRTPARSLIFIFGYTCCAVAFALLSKQGTKIDGLNWLFPIVIAGCFLLSFGIISELNKDKHDKSGMGCVVSLVLLGYFCLAGIYSLLIAEYWLWLQFWFHPLVLAALYFVIYELYAHIYGKINGTKEAKFEIDRLERKAAEDKKRTIIDGNNRALAMVNGEAESLTKRAMNCYTASKQAATDLPVLLKNATGWLQSAQVEYNNSAFAPFWDAVEKAAINLAAFSDKVRLLSTNSTEYYQLLKGRKHTFPEFSLIMSAPPDATPVMNEFFRVVRLGQTNFQFANIWEHRRTREVLISGFRTLGEAVNDLGWVISQSILSLRQSISTDLAKVVEEEIKTRDALDERMAEQNKMIDNIQRHREP